MGIKIRDFYGSVEPAPRQTAGLNPETGRFEVGAENAENLGAPNFRPNNRFSINDFYGEQAPKTKNQGLGFQQVITQPIPPPERGTEMLGAIPPVGGATTARPYTPIPGMIEPEPSAGRIASSAARALGRGAADVALSLPEQFAVGTYQQQQAIVDQWDRIDRGEAPDIGAVRSALGLRTGALTPVTDYAAASPQERQAMRAALTPLAEQPGMGLAEAGRSAVADVLPVDPAAQRAAPFTHALAQGLGSTLGFAAVGLAGGALGAPALPMMALTGSAANASGQFRDALESGASFEDAARASNLSGVAGLSEAVPIARIFDRWDKATGGTIKRTLVEAAKSATEEGLQELGQTLADNLIASKIVAYDPERGILTGTGEAAGVGASVGGLLGFAAAMFGARLRGPAIEQRGELPAGPEPVVEEAPPAPEPEPLIEPRQATAELERFRRAAEEGTSLTPEEAARRMAAIQRFRDVSVLRKTETAEPVSGGEFLEPQAVAAETPVAPLPVPLPPEARQAPTAPVEAPTVTPEVIALPGPPEAPVEQPPVQTETAPVVPPAEPAAPVIQPGEAQEPGGQAPATPIETPLPERAEQTALEGVLTGPEPEPDEIGALPPPLAIEGHTDKLMIIRGDTKPNRQRIKAAGIQARWNARSGGWTFPARWATKARTTLGDLVGAAEEPTPLVTEPVSGEKVKTTPEATPQLAEPQVETDEATRQRIRNSIVEGELLLRTGTKNDGSRYTEPELQMIRRSVDRAYARLGSTPPAENVTLPAPVETQPVEIPQEPVAEDVTSPAEEVTAPAVAEVAAEPERGEPIPVPDHTDWVQLALNGTPVTNLGQLDPKTKRRFKALVRNGDLQEYVDLGFPTPHTAYALPGASQPNLVTKDQEKTMTAGQRLVAIGKAKTEALASLAARREKAGEPRQPEPDLPALKAEADRTKEAFRSLPKTATRRERADAAAAMREAAQAYKSGRTVGIRGGARVMRPEPTEAPEAKEQPAARPPEPVTIELPLHMAGRQVGVIKRGDIAIIADERSVTYQKGGVTKTADYTPVIISGLDQDGADIQKVTSMRGTRGYLKKRRDWNAIYTLPMHLIRDPKALKADLEDLALEPIERIEGIIRGHATTELPKLNLEGESRPDHRGPKQTQLFDMSEAPHPAIIPPSRLEGFKPRDVKISVPGGYITVRQTWPWTDWYRKEVERRTRADWEGYGAKGSLGLPKGARSAESATARPEFRTARATVDRAIADGTLGDRLTNMHENGVEADEELAEALYELGLDYRDMTGPGDIEAQITEFNAGVPWAKIWDWWLGPLFDRYWEPLGTLPNRDAYLGPRYRALGKAGTGNELTKEMYERLRKLDPEDSEQVYQYLTTAGAKPSSISDPEARAVAVEAKAILDVIGRQLVENGILSQAQYETYKDRYLPRIYLKYLMDGTGASMGASNRPQVSRQTMDRARKRKDIPKWVRQIALGEVEDPAFLVAKAMGAAIRDIAILNFLKQVARNGEWIYPGGIVKWGHRWVTPRWLVSEAQGLRERVEAYPEKTRPYVRALADVMDQKAREALPEPPDPKLYRQVPDTKRYGVMRGLWVRREIYEDIVGDPMITGPEAGVWHEVESKLMGVHSLWKWAKTAASPSTQARNFIGNAVLIHLSGVPMAKIPYRVAQALREIRTNGRHWQVAKQYGVTEVTFSAQELGRIESEFRDHLKASGTKVPMRTQLADLFAKFHNATSDLYGMSEAVWKTAKIIDEMGKGASPEQAALASHRAVFDYSLVPQLVRRLRNYPLGLPFLTFVFKALPITLEAAFKNPMAFMPYIVGPMIMTAITAAAFDVDEDDLEKLKKLLPEWIQRRGHAMILPWKDENDRWQFLDYGYVVPWVAYADILANLGEGNVKEVAGMFGGPVANILTGLTTNKDPFFDREIMHDGDPPAKRFYDMMAWTFNQMVPQWMGLGSGQVAQLIDAVNGTPTRTGEPGRSVGQALGRLAGMNVYSVDPVEQRRWGIYRREREIRDAEARLSSIRRNRALSREQRRDEMGTQREFIKKLKDELRAWRKKTTVPLEMRSRKQYERQQQDLGANRQGGQNRGPDQGAAAQRVSSYITSGDDTAIAGVSATPDQVIAGARMAGSPALAEIMRGMLAAPAQ